MITPRRSRVWADLHIDVNLATGGVSLQNLLVNAVVDAQTKTVIRCLGRLRCIPSVVANSTVSAQLVALGIGVTSRDAFAVGSAAVPNPFTATDVPTVGWLYKEHAVLVNQ